MIFKNKMPEFTFIKSLILGQKIQKQNEPVYTQNIPDKNFSDKSR